MIHHFFHGISGLPEAPLCKNWSFEASFLVIPYPTPRRVVEQRNGSDVAPKVEERGWWFSVLSAVLHQPGLS